MDVPFEVVVVPESNAVSAGTFDLAMVSIRVRRTASVEQLRAALAMIPVGAGVDTEERMQSAFWYCDRSDDAYDEAPIIVFDHFRPATSEETAAWKTEAAEAAARIRESEEARDRATYERLRPRFEPNVAAWGERQYPVEGERVRMPIGVQNICAAWRGRSNLRPGKWCWVAWWEGKENRDDDYDTPELAEAGADEWLLEQGARLDKPVGKL